MRISSSATVHFCATAADSLSHDDGTAINVQPGDRITVTSVGLLPFPVHLSHVPNELTTYRTTQAPATADAQTVDSTRGRDSYAHFAALPSNALLAGGREIGETALTEMFRAVFKRANVRRVAGPQGELKKVVSVRGDGEVEYLREDWGGKGDWPVSMKVCWDE